jgi:hypothetical protein
MASFQYHSYTYEPIIQSSDFRPENRGSIFFRNNNIHSQTCTMPQPTIQSFFFLMGVKSESIYYSVIAIWRPPPECRKVTTQRQLTNEPICGVSGQRQGSPLRDQEWNSMLSAQATSRGAVTEWYWWNIDGIIEKVAQWNPTSICVHERFKRKLNILNYFCYLLPNFLHFKRN